MNKLLEKKLSIGLSLDITIEDFKRIIKKYENYIESIYFSPPLGDIFQSRKIVANQFKNPENVKKFYQILQLCKENNIKLDCVLNRPSLKREEVEKATNYIKKLEVDDITCLKDHIQVVQEHLPNTRKIYSFNNSFRIQDLDKIDSNFNMIVLGREFLRRPNFIQKVHDKGYQIKLLVNNGCSFNCGGCKNDSTNQCMNRFRENMNHYGINYVYALQSFYPEELDYLLKNCKCPIESIKISNRTSNTRYLEDCLDSYINVRDTDDYLKKSNKAYQLWGRSSGFNSVLSKLDNQKIKQIKKQLQEKTKF